MRVESENLNLEKIIDNIFLKGYRHKLNEFHGKKIVDAFFLEFQNLELLNYLANPSVFDLQKTHKLFSVCDDIFSKLPNRKIDTGELQFLLPKLFLERIRYPFVYNLSQENEEQLKAVYKPEWIDRTNKSGSFDSLKRDLIWHLSTSESRVARQKHLGFKVRTNYSLAALKHFSESCKFGNEKNIDYSGYLGTNLLTLGKEIYVFKHKNDLIESLADEFRKDLEGVSDNSELYFGLLKILKGDMTLDEISLFCLEEAKKYYKNFFERYNAGEKPSKNIQKAYSTNRVMLGETSFFLASTAKTNEERLSFLEESRENFKEAIAEGYDKEEIGKLRTYALLSNLARDEADPILNLSLETEEKFQLLNLELESKRREPLIRLYTNNYISNLEKGLEQATRPEDRAYFLFHQAESFKLLRKVLKEGVVCLSHAKYLFEKNKRICYEELGRFIVKNREKIGLEQISQGTNPICVPIGREGILKTALAFKISSDRESLDREESITKWLRKILIEKFSYKGFFVPTPVDIVNLGDRRCAYCMQIVYGKTLYEKIKEKREKPWEVERYLDKVIDFLALIHANIDLRKFGLSDRIPYDKFREKREKKIREPFNKFQLEEEKAKLIIENLEPIMRDVYNNNPYTVFYKDAQQTNWIITPNDDVDALDFEIKESTIPEYDLVCLIESMPIGRLKVETKDELIKKYGEYLSFYTGEKFRDWEESRKIYLNLSLGRAAVVARTFSNSRKNSIWNNAILSYLTNVIGTKKHKGNIERIEEGYPSYYSKFSLNYKGLREGLSYLEEGLYKINKQLNRNRKNIIDDIEGGGNI